MVQPLRLLASTVGGPGGLWWGAGSIPGQRPKILHAEQLNHKRKKKKKKDCLKLVGKFQNNLAVFTGGKTLYYYFYYS